MPDISDSSSFEDVFDHVGPGKLIRSELLAWMLEQLRDLDDRVGEGILGRVDVPILTGRTLADAAAILGQSTVELRLGPVLDTAGTSVNGGSPENADRVVLGQTPGPDDRVPSDSLVRLLVTAPTETAAPPPTITGFEPDPVRVNELLSIRGRNYPQTWSPDLNDRVTFGGVEGPVQTNQSTPRILVVRVPTGIPGVPESGETPTPVTVVVSVRGRTDSGEVDVLPPTGQAVPSISSIDAADGGAINPDSTIVIRGSNFADTASDNTVIFNDDETRTATAVVDGGIEAVVPTAQDLGLSGNGGFVEVFVEVGGVRSDGFIIEVLIPQ